MNITNKKFFFNKSLLINDIRKYFFPITILSLYVLICFIFRIRVCPINYISGFPCPACGITRSFFMLLKGNFIESLKFHPFAIIIFIYAIFFIIGRYFLNISIKILQNIFLVIGCFMIAFYIFRMIVYYPSFEPVDYNYNSLFYYIYSKVSLK